MLTAMSSRSFSPAGVSSVEPIQVIHCDLGRLFEFEVGSLLIALLMFPLASEIDQRLDAFLGLCAGFSAEQTRSVPAEADFLREVRPEYFGVAPNDYRRVLRQAKTLLRHRMLAALMARPFVDQAILGDAYQIPRELGELMPSNVAEYVSANHKIMSGENLMQRAWRPSLPVLHLAIGFESASQQRALPQTDVQDPDELIEPRVGPLDLQDIELFRSAVQLSREAAVIVRGDDRFKIADQKIVEIRWDE